MNYNKIFFYVLFLIFSLSSPTQAKSPIYASKTQEKVFQEAPQPKALTPSWWTFFEEEPEVLEKKIQLFKQTLQELLDSYPDLAPPTEIQLLVNKILLNLKRLPELRREKSSPPPSFPKFKNIYSIEDVIGLFQRVSETQKNLSILKEEIKSQSKKIDNAQNVDDTLMAKYLVFI